MNGEGWAPPHNAASRTDGIWALRLRRSDRMKFAPTCDLRRRGASGATRDSGVLHPSSSARSAYMRTPNKADPISIHLALNEAGCRVEGCERWAFDTGGACRPCMAGKPPGKKDGKAFKPSKIKPGPVYVPPSPPQGFHYVASPFQSIDFSPDTSPLAQRYPSSPEFIGKVDVPVPVVIARRAYADVPTGAPPPLETVAKIMTNRTPIATPTRPPTSSNEHGCKKCINGCDVWAFRDGDICRSCVFSGVETAVAVRTKAQMPVSLDPARSFAPKPPVLEHLYEKGIIREVYQQHATEQAAIAASQQEALLW